MSDSTDKRSEIRLLEEATVFIETFSSPSDEKTLTNIVISKTVDLSANGVQVIMDKPLPIGCILQLCIEISSKDKRFHLTGEVMWVTEQQGSKTYLVGFKLLESDFTKIAEWKEYICERLEGDEDWVD